MTPVTQEAIRLQQAQERTAHWRRWGPYLSERQWGTVREDYSPYGAVGDFFPHDHARSRLTAGAKMVWPGSVIIISAFVLP